MTRVISYRRVSTEEQSREGVSLESQAVRIADYCKLYGLTIVADIEDAGVSAKSLKRPGIQRALAMLANNEADGIVITKLDRLVRSVRDLVFLIEGHFSEKKGKGLFSVADNLDTKSAMGRFIIYLFGNLAELERALIAERVREALGHKSSCGQRVGSVPYGFDLAADGKMLVPNQCEQTTIRLMRQLREAGYSYRAIAAELDDRGIKTKEGQSWLPASVRRVLKRQGPAEAA
jgi:site-specific DNA recombinase